MLRPCPDAGGVYTHKFTRDLGLEDGYNPFHLTNHAVAAVGWGVTDDAKNQCGYAPCQMSNAHRTIKFTFHTTTPGHFRWQCFVPCAAGWIDGFGGPMQTIGYMDGFLNVKAA